MQHGATRYSRAYHSIAKDRVALNSRAERSRAEQRERRGGRHASVFSLGRPHPPPSPLFANRHPTFPPNPPLLSCFGGIKDQPNRTGRTRSAGASLPSTIPVPRRAGGRPNKQKQEDQPTSRRPSPAGCRRGRRSRTARGEKCHPPGSPG